MLLKEFNSHSHRKDGEKLWLDLNIVKNECPQLLLDFLIPRMQFGTYEPKEQNV